MQSQTAWAGIVTALGSCMATRRRHGGLVAIAAILLTFPCVGALGGEDPSAEHVQEGFRRELVRRGLASVIPVLEDHGITSLSILAKMRMATRRGSASRIITARPTATTRGSASCTTRDTT